MYAIRLVLKVVIRNEDLLNSHNPVSCRDKRPICCWEGLAPNCLEMDKTNIGKRFQGKVAIVTASTQGIGFSIAERLGLEGASVVISSRRQVHYSPSIFHFPAFFQKIRLCYFAITFGLESMKRETGKKEFFFFIRFLELSFQSSLFRKNWKSFHIQSWLFSFGLFYRRKMLMRLQKNSELMESKYWQLSATFQMPSKGRIW